MLGMLETWLVGIVDSNRSDGKRGWSLEMRGDAVYRSYLGLQ